MASKPDVFSHNLETISYLYDRVRKGSDYKRSIKILKYARDIGFKVKTGITLGLGEMEQQVYKIIKDRSKY